ncbi:MAG: hypothetical protein JRN26_02145 [Nitrososphaerota archaeon]|nr:hypothetical protein [Nitrososphaerota archaeon]MDG6935678.1 hypothetical protein [Nitrososphaerota archaeon]MDG6943453.1 hypothetical protein [Nitrososphaerota archaeon]
MIKIDDQNIEATLDNAICPYTINALLRKKTFSAIIVNASYGILMHTDIISGYEKAKTSFKPGDLAFDPKGSWLIVFKTENEYSNKANPVGHMQFNDINKFSGAKNVVLEFK